MSSKLFLENPNDIVVLFGKEFTAEQLKDAVIDSHIYRNRLKKNLRQR